MTTENNNITITMQDVDVVRQLSPAFAQALMVASVARSKAAQTECCGAEETCCRTEGE